MRINRKRLEESMDALGKIGATPKGGLTREALTDDDRRGRDLLVGWMREAGLTVTVDQMGNIFGGRAGSDSRSSAAASEAPPCTSVVSARERGSGSASPG